MGSGARPGYPAKVPSSLPSSRRLPEPAPRPTDDRRVVLAGTVVWLVLLAASLVLADDLAEAGRSWWIWTCVAGATLGALGLVHLNRRGRRGRSGG